MTLGLSESELLQIRRVLEKYPPVAEALLFGSRAMGNHKKASDVDIALKGNLNLSMVAKIKAELDEKSSLPYFFDVVDYQTIETPEFKQHIDQFGKNIYSRG